MPQQIDFPISPFLRFLAAAIGLLVCGFFVGQIRASWAVHTATSGMSAGALIANFAGVLVGLGLVVRALLVSSQRWTVSKERIEVELRNLVRRKHFAVDVKTDVWMDEDYHGDAARTWHLVVERNDGRALRTPGAARKSDVEELRVRLRTALIG